jgi:drug/metabolite transporter (DMT)-like permease
MNYLFKIVIAMLLWGSIGIFVKNIDLPSIELVFLRAIIASFVLAIYGLVIRSTKNNELMKSEITPKYKNKNIYYLIISGIAMGLNWLFLFQSYKYTTISNSTLSYYCAPIFVILLSPFILKEKFTKSKFLAVLVAMVGLFLILSNQISAYNSSYNNVKGIVYGLIAAILYASIILLNKYIKGLSGYEMTVIQISTAALVLLPFVILRHNLHISNTKTLVFVLIVGVIHTGLAYLLYFSSIKYIKAQSVAVISYIDPISALIFGAIFLKENMSTTQILGGILILLSTFFGNLDKNKA